MKIRVLTLNIHRAVNWQGVFDLEGLINFIKEQDPDIVGLQEVEQNLIFNRSFLDIPGELDKRLRMSSFYSVALKRINFNFGNLVLSKHPIIQAWSFSLPGNLEPRSFAFTQLLMNGVRINFLTTHLGLSIKERLQQVNKILEFVNQVSGPLIITGDFNGGKEDPAVKILTDRFLDLQGNQLPTEAGTFRLKDGKVNSRMDYILTSPEFYFEKFQIINNFISDHLPVIGDFSLKTNHMAIAGEPILRQL